MIFIYDLTTSISQSEILLQLLEKKIRSGMVVRQKENRNKFHMKQD